MKSEESTTPGLWRLGRRITIQGIHTMDAIRHCNCHLLRKAIWALLSIETRELASAIVSEHLARLTS